MLADRWLDGQIAWLRANYPAVPMVAVTEANGAGPLPELVARLGMQGYIPTTSSMGVATAVLHLVAAGGTYVPPALQGTPPKTLMNPSCGVSKTTRVAGLTPRESEVLELLERGMANKIIAYRLSLSQSMVKAHVHNILSKLKVNNRTEAAVTAHSLHSAAVDEDVLSDMRLEPFIGLESFDFPDAANAVARLEQCE